MTDPKSLTLLQLQERKASVCDSLRKNYFMPFVESLGQSELNPNEIISLTFCFLQKNQHAIMFRIYLDFEMNHFLYGFDDSHLPNSLKNPLQKYADLKKALISLARIYLHYIKQQNEFPGIDRAEIQTCIRELFHNYLNPLPKLNRAAEPIPFNWDKVTLADDDLIFNRPAEIQCKLYSYLDYKTGQFFKNTCRSAYLLHSDMKNPPFYIVVDSVHIRNLYRFYKFGENTAPLKPSISNEALMADWNAVDAVKIFESLYQALEYIQFFPDVGSSKTLQQGGIIASLWVGEYLGNLQDLSFRQQKLIFDNYSSGRYALNKREASVYYTIAPKESIRPLLGTVLYAYPDFAHYKIFNMVDASDNQNRMASSFNIRRFCSVM